MQEWIVLLWPKLLVFVTAELTMILVRSGDIQVLAKDPGQLTSNEFERVNRGLKRSFWLEFWLFVPTSAVLGLLILGPLMRQRLAFPDALFYAMLGVVSYGFPFAAIRRIVTLIALDTLKRFAELRHDFSSREVRESKSPEDLLE